MYDLIEFFEPIDVSTWLLRVLLLYGGSYLIVWVVALLASWSKWNSQGGIIMRVYFGWLIPFAIHSIIFTLFMLDSAKYYKELGISLWYCVAYLIPSVLSAAVGIDLSVKISERIKRTVE